MPRPLGESRHGLESRNRRGDPKTEFQQRCAKALEAVENEEFPLPKRLELAQQAFSGLNLTALSPETREDLERKLVKVNGILSRYEITTYDDYKLISPSDLRKILEIVSRLASKALASDPDVEMRRP